MTFSVNDFRANMALGGLRMNLFDVSITNPVDSSADPLMQFRVRSADWPESELNEVVASFKGRRIKFPGNRNYADWSVDVQEDADLSVHNALSAWNSAMNSHQGNVNTLPTPEALNYKSVANIRLYNSLGSIIAERQFIGVWPRVVDRHRNDWDNDNIVVFPVTFSYDYWIPVSGSPSIRV